MEINATAILFDLDGVLADSIAQVEKSWRGWSDFHGLDFDRVIAVTHGRRKREILEMIAPQLDPDVEVARLIAIEHDNLDLVKSIPGAAALVQSLPPDSWAVGTSGEREVALSRLRKLGMPIPKVLIAAEDVTRGKPDPTVYLKAAEGIHADPASCVVFEDAPLGIEAALAGGMTPVGLLTTYPAAALNGAVTAIPNFLGVRARVEAGRLQGLTLESGHSK